MLIITALCLSSVSAAAATIDRSLEQHPLTAKTTPIDASLFNDLERSSRLADITYCVTPPSAGITSPFECFSRCSEFPHFELVTVWNTGPLLSDSAGFIALDHEQDSNGNGKVVVAFRGTYSFANAIVDLSTIPQPYTPYPGEEEEDDDDGDDNQKLIARGCKNCTVHVGFNRAWHNTRDKIMRDILNAFVFHPRYELILVGHSLGGAVALLGALELQARGFNPTVTTFGEPRVGNEALARYVDDRFDLSNSSTAPRYRRVTHVDDPIPLLPLTEWGYAMHAGEVFISKPDLAPGAQDVRLCIGDADPSCIAQQDNTVTPGVASHLLDTVRDEIIDVLTEPWGIPSRYKLWQLVFAHRDYFHRLGVCLPGGDPFEPAPTEVPGT